MNERSKLLAEQAGAVFTDCHAASLLDDEIEKFADLMTTEFISLLEYEIELCEQYKATSCNDFDRRWQEGKIQHFHKLIDKTKKHFGVDNVGT
jgi:hypothetical protein